MTKKALFLGGALIAILSGCGAFQQPDGYPTLPPARATPLKPLALSGCIAPQGGRCDIQITVGANCDIAVSPEYLVVFAKGPVHLFWTVGPANWSFRDQGIHFKSATQSELFDGQRVSGNVWRWQNRNSVAGYLPYGIRVVSNSGQECDVDPGLWNAPVQ